MYILVRRTTLLSRNGCILESDAKAYYSNTKKDTTSKLFNEYNKLIKYIDKRSSLYRLGEDEAINKNYAWCAGDGSVAEMSFTECSKLRGADFYPNYFTTLISFEIIKAKAIPPQVGKS